MNIFKIKRKLASQGIGDPLLTLIKTPEEIEEMKNKGEITPNKIVYSTRHNIDRRQNSNGRFAVAYNFNRHFHILSYRFTSIRRARAWSLWNYKERTDCWKIIEITKGFKEIIVQ